MFGGITVTAPPTCAMIFWVACHASVPFDFLGVLPRHLNAWSPAVPIGLVAGLRIDQILCTPVHRAETARAVSTLGNGSVYLPANAIIERQPGRDLPRVLYPCVVVFPMDRRRTDMRPAG